MIKQRLLDMLLTIATNLISMQLGLLIFPVPAMTPAPASAQVAPVQHTLATGACVPTLQEALSSASSEQNEVERG